MAKLQVKDLTPELLAEMKDLKTAQEVKEFLAAKGFEVSDKGADIIATQLKEGETELTEEQLAAVSGGCGNPKFYGGSQEIKEEDINNN